jgi:hypothetical protein
MKKLISEIGLVTESVEQTVSATNTLLEPVRKSFFKRFPTLSMLAVTCGVATTLLGIERIIEDIPLFNEHPVYIFLIGVCILAVTGKLYSKLG